MSLYYQIWVDCILKAQSVPANRNNWKQFTIIFMSMSMALNIGTILSIIQLHVIGHVFYDIKFNIFPGEKLNNLLSFFVLYLVVPLALNYLLIFKGSRYKRLLKKYKYCDGKLFLTYFVGSVLVSLIYGLFFTPTVQ